MDKRLFDTVSIITAAVLLPAVAVSVWAVVTGRITFTEYRGLWSEPLALLIGFWFRGFGPNTGSANTGKEV